MAPKDWLKVLGPDDVTDARSFAEYCQQTLGAPYPRGKEWATLNTKAKEFFEEKPQATWGTLCRVVMWARMKKKRPSAAWKVVGMWKWAWEDGALPELDPS